MLKKNAFVALLINSDTPINEEDIVNTLGKEGLEVTTILSSPFEVNKTKHNCFDMFKMHCEAADNLLKQLEKERAFFEKSMHSELKKEIIKQVSVVQATCNDYDTKKSLCGYIDDALDELLYGELNTESPIETVFGKLIYDGIDVSRCEMLLDVESNIVKIVKDKYEFYMDYEYKAFEDYNTIKYYKLENNSFCELSVSAIRSKL